MKYEFAIESYRSVGWVEQGVGVGEASASAEALRNALNQQTQQLAVKILV